MNDADGFRLEAAAQFGATCDVYTFTEAQLLAFAKGCERAGRGEAVQMARALEKDARDQYAAQIHGEFASELERRNAAIDAELAPILAAEEARFMTAQGYVRASDDQPGARWIKPATKREPCEYCCNGKRTGLPGNACENCMNTGLKNPTAEDLR